MQKLSFREALHAGGLFSLLTRAFAVLVALGCFIATAWTQTAEKRTDLAIRPESYGRRAGTSGGSALATHSAHAHPAIDDCGDARWPETTTNRGHTA